MKKIVAAFLAAMCFGVVSYAQTIGVLCYHSISNNPLKYSEYCISTQEFEEDVKYFTEQGYNLVKPCNMWYAKGDKNIVLTSDDGYEDFYTNVFPILKKYKACAAVYIMSSKINKSGYLKDWQIKEMHDSGLVEIGNHMHIMHRRGMETLRGYYNDEIMLKEAVEDIKRCSDEIEKITGKATESMAYPYGVYTDRLNSILRNNLGFTTSFSTHPGILKGKADFQNPIKRIYRCHGDTPQQMIETINNYKAK